MIIDLGRLAQDGEMFEGDEPASIFELDDAFCRPQQPVHYHVSAQVVSGKLIVRGTLATTVGLRCSRCGEFFDRPVRENDFERVYDLDSEDVPRVPEQPEYVDLTPDIREASILNFPAYPVCRAECRGLCPMCGKNLNEEACDCERPGEMRWDALDDIKLR